MENETLDKKISTLRKVGRFFVPSQPELFLFLGEAATISPIALTAKNSLEAWCWGLGAQGITYLGGRGYELLSRDGEAKQSFIESKKIYEQAAKILWNKCVDVKYKIEGICAGINTL